MNTVRKNLIRKQIKCIRNATILSVVCTGQVLFYLSCISLAVCLCVCVTFIVM